MFIELTEIRRVKIDDSNEYKIIEGLTSVKKESIISYADDGSTCRVIFGGQWGYYEIVVRDTYEEIKYKIEKKNK